ncbi:S41 family peptidase [Flavobacterium sp. U410]
MKLKYYLWIAFIFSSEIINAQQQNCNCSQSLEKLIEKIETEYPGFAEKTKDTLLYSTLKNNLKKETKIASNDSCLPILKKYVSFFKDRHIWLLPNEDLQNNTVSANTQSEIYKIDVKKFKKQALKSTDKLEGIWKNDTYEIGIKKTKPNEYVGFIINTDSKFWKPNEIKFRLFNNGTFEYKMQDHSLQKGTYYLDEELLYFKEILTELVKQTPNKIVSTEEITNKINELNGFYCKRLTAKTAVLKLSNFSYPFVETIENLIEKNKDILQNTENLIIDLRGNSGGTTDAFQKLLPYILTNSVRNYGTEYLSTPSFINGMKKYRASLVDNEKNKTQIADIENRLRILEANSGKFVNFSNSTVEIETVNFESKSPKQIIFLSDNKIGSAAESFLLIAKQSKKVKVIGTPTSGVLDYANAYFFDDFACTKYKLLMPTYRSFRLPDYPIDNIGIQPDIYLDKSIKNWEEFAIEYLEK